MARRDTWWNRPRRAPSPPPREVRGRKAGWGHLARSRGPRLGERGPGRLAGCPPGFGGTARAHTELLFIVLVPRGAVHVIPKNKSSIRAARDGFRVLR